MLLAACGDPEEQPPPPAGCDPARVCTRQSQCGPVGDAVCAAGCCAPAGVLGGDGGTEIQRGFAKLNMTLSSAVRAQDPNRFRLWAFYPKNPDGTTLTCAKVLEGSAPAMDALNPVREEPTLVPITNLCSGCAVSALTGTLPAGVPLVFYVEMYHFDLVLGPPVGRGCSTGNLIDPGEAGNNHVYGMEIE